MNLHQEIHFEDSICEALAQQGWLYHAQANAEYDRALALYPPDVFAWLEQSQPEAWQLLQPQQAKLLERIRDQLQKRSTLDVLRNGIDWVGLKQSIKLAEFKPALGLNPEIMARYSANRLRVIRQVRYSTQNENSIDLVLFLNGLPVATLELKSDFTQSVQDAIDQYRYDRFPKTAGKTEPLLSFPQGALVHFAVSHSEVHMTTKLEGKSTKFLPFNQGDDGGKGNPENPKGGFRVAYLWEQVLERESWLELLGRYLITTKNKKKEPDGLIFPRYHQLIATRNLIQTVLKEGAGQKYLIQHSAGSGKTNSIAWTAHFLADLHDANQKKIFQSVIVVSDRKVIDGQLQEAIDSFQRTVGVVATIKGDKGSKSKQLADALAAGKKVVVCTIQTFPFALEEVQRLAATEGKTFAVIADEAHSSQTGKAAEELKKTLTAAELEELKDGGEVSTEDLLAAQMKARASEAGITYVAFTATPKAKTLELFGRRPQPHLPASDENLPRPFHVYSMKQAVEEGFILDVLRNYTPYKLAFRLATEGKEISDKEVDKSDAMRSLMSWVRLHEYNISQKIQVVVEHYLLNIKHLLDGQAKAMVVLGSRKEAVRWKLAIDKYIKSKGYPIGTLVAFSGEVIDKDSGPNPFTESNMNSSLKGRDIKEVFNTPDYQILLVANKFQTGFDQPLLCGMYVDRRLAGVQAVQTLSRLNRSHTNKDTTYVLDFSDSSEDVLKAFGQYYGEAMLESVTDPNIILDLRARLDNMGYYDEHEVERVVLVALDENAKQSDLVKAVEPVASRLLKKFQEAKNAWIQAIDAEDEAAQRATKEVMEVLELFKKNLQTYLRAYGFLSQIFDYGNTAIEKRAIFFRYLVKLLDFGREREAVDTSKVVLTHHKLISQGKLSISPEGTEEGENKLKPLTEAGSGKVSDEEKILLEDIIQKVNELFDGELTEGDQLSYINGVIKSKLLESPILRQQAQNNTKEQFANSPDLKGALMDAIIGALEAHQTMSTQALNNEKVQDGLKDILLGPAKLWESLRSSFISETTAPPT